MFDLSSLETQYFIRSQEVNLLPLFITQRKWLEHLRELRIEEQVSWHLHTFLFSAVWDLQISGVAMSDDALYQCQVGGSMQVDPIVSDPVRLTVYVETTKPQILQGEEVEVVEGREEELQCMAEGRPRPEVQSYFIIHSWLQII